MRPDVQEPKTFREAAERIVQEMVDLLVSKQHDYGPGNILAFGELGVLVRVNDKVERLKNLLKSGATPKHESIEDSWTDLSVYGVIAKMLRRGWFTLPLEDGRES